MAQKDRLNKKHVPSIYLAGFMCAGKTAVGREAARLAGARHFDTDLRVKKLSGRTAADIINSRGENAFRRLEARAAEDLLALNGVVVSFGGGLRFDRGRLNALRKQNGVTVWLKTPRRIIVERIARNPSAYPLIGETLKTRIEAKVRSLLNARAALYRKADIALVCGDKTPAALAALLLRKVASFRKAE